MLVASIIETLFDCWVIAIKQFVKCFLNSTTDTWSELLNTICFKTLEQQGIWELVFYGDVVYKFKRIAGKPNFIDRFKRYKNRYYLDIMRLVLKRNHGL